MSFSGGPTMEIWKKWSMTQRLAMPASSASRAIRAKVGPMPSGASGQVKFEIWRPSFMC